MPDSGASPDFIPSPEQQEAMDLISAWHSSPWSGSHSREPGVFRLMGFAGVGKTTLVKHVISSLGLDAEEDVAFGAYTGKAAHMLRTRGGVPTASTIHRMIYLPVEKDREKLRELESEQLSLEKELRSLSPDSDSAEPDSSPLRARLATIEEAVSIERRKLRSPSFVLNHESDVRSKSLVVIDEVSMVDEKMARHLLSFDVPILVLGDPAQLPPVGGGGYFTECTPDAMLTSVQRHALESPVGRLAMSARSARDSQCGIYGLDSDSGRVAHLGVPDLAARDVVLCRLNKTRYSLISSLRAAAGKEPGVPYIGDEIIILRNNYDLGVFNGQVVTILFASESPSQDFSSIGPVWDLTVLDNGEVRELPVLGLHASSKGDEDAFTSLHHKATGHIALAVFADALTVHKAQGSEWDHVAIVDESKGIYGMRRYKEKASHEEASLSASQWTYTAVTRASKSVVVSASFG